MDACVIWQTQSVVADGKSEMIFDRFQMAAKALLGRKYAGSSALIFPDDVMLTSYPKSGNTWARFLIGNLISDKGVNFANVESIVPDIYRHDQAYLLSIKRPRILKSHESFCPSYKRVIYIVRDPRDVAVSYYFHQIKFRNIEKSVSLDSYVESFIVGEPDRFGSWGENVGSWLGARQKDDGFLLVRYEDLLLNPINEMKTIADFFRIDKTEQKLQQIVDMSSLTNMKEMERISGKHWEALKKTRNDMAFVRSGKSGGWKELLSKNSSTKIVRAWTDLMVLLKYK